MIILGRHAVRPVGRLPQEEHREEGDVHEEHHRDEHQEPQEQGPQVPQLRRIAETSARDAVPDEAKAQLLLGNHQAAAEPIFSAFDLNPNL